MHTDLHTYTHTYIPTYICICIHTYMHANQDTSTYIHVYVYVYIYIYMHIHIYMLTHTYTYTYTFTYTFRLPFLSVYKRSINFFFRDVGGSVQQISNNICFCHVEHSGTPSGLLQTKKPQLLSFRLSCPSPDLSTWADKPQRMKGTDIHCKPVSPRREVRRRAGKTEGRQLWLLGLQQS